MDAKAKLKADQGAQPGLQPLEPMVTPTAPGRVGGGGLTTKKEEAAPPKNKMGRNVIIAHAVGIPSVIGGGFMLGPDASQIAFKTVKGVMIAISHMLPNFFS